MNSGRPAGTVTFLFTDIVGSTALLEQLGGEKYAELLAGQRADLARRLRPVRRPRDRHPGRLLLRLLPRAPPTPSTP